MPETEEKKNSKVFVGLYISFCVLFITWLTSKFFKGRRQIHQAFDTIGEQLQRMQDQLDQRQAAEEGSQLQNSNGGHEKNGNENQKSLSTLVEQIESDAEKEKIKDE